MSVCSICGDDLTHYEAVELAADLSEPLCSACIRSGDRRHREAGERNGLDPLDFAVVPIEAFAAVDEPGGDPLIGTEDDPLISQCADAMAYGDGGAGKTTLVIDLTFHAAAGDEWLGIPIPRPLNVLVIENEGPRAPFRKKLDAKLAGWTGSPLQGRIHVLERPWAQFTFAEAEHREALARKVAELGTDLVIVGPVTASGMEEAGTLQDVRAFAALLGDVRQRSGGCVTFLLVHHENKRGAVSGAWEGVGDTLLHVHGQGNGHTRLFVQKARWASDWQGRTLSLAWAENAGFTVEQAPELSDDELAEMIVAAIRENPGTGWRQVERAVPGISAERRREVRDRLLRDGVIVNVVTDKNTDEQVALDHCPEKRRARLYPGDDPTIRHLRLESDSDQTQSASARGAGENVHLKSASRSKSDADSQTQFAHPRDQENGT